MSIKAMSWVWDNSKQKGAKLLVLLAIADRCDDEGVCFPGHARLAKKSRTTKQTVSKHIKALEAAGELSVTVHGGTKTTHGNTNRYYLRKYRDSLNLETPDGNRSEYVTYDGVSKRIPQEVSKPIPDGVSDSIPYSSDNPSDDTSVRLSNKLDNNAASDVATSSDDLSANNDNGGVKLPDDYRTLTCHNCGKDINGGEQVKLIQDTGLTAEHYEVLDAFIKAGDMTTSTFIGHRKQPLVTYLCDIGYLASKDKRRYATDAGRAALKAWQDKQADCSGPERCDSQQTEHVGALCEVKPGKMYGMNGKPISDDIGGFTCALCHDDISRIDRVQGMLNHHSPDLCRSCFDWLVALPPQPQPEPEAKKPNVYLVWQALRKAMYPLAKLPKYMPGDEKGAANNYINAGGTLEDAPAYVEWARGYYKREQWTFKFCSIGKSEHWALYQTEKQQEQSAIDSSQEVTFEIEDDDFIVTQDEN
jgi:hypothetical protein